MATAAIYARVSSARQAKDETIASQTLALREHARAQGLDVPEEWVFEDAGHSGTTLVRARLSHASAARRVSPARSRTSARKPHVTTSPARLGR